MRFLALTSIFISFLTGCALHNYGDDQFQLRMAAHGKDIMWVPTRVDTATQMLALAQVKSGDIVYDLGSGDGVIPIQAAKRYGIRAVGIEYNPDLVALSKRNAIRENVQNLVTFKQGDIFVEDFSSARHPSSFKYISHGLLDSGSRGFNKIRRIHNRRSE
jgi:tRNA G37 N-methylase Trm5